MLSKVANGVDSSRGWVNLWVASKHLPEIHDGLSIVDPSKPATWRLGTGSQSRGECNCFLF